MLVIKLKQRGDTIVEVLICLLILGTALGFSYRLASLSTQATRRAQERSEALVFTQSKLEEFKSAYTKPGAKAIYDGLSSSDRFCSDLSLASPYKQDINPATQLYNTTNHPARCASTTTVKYMTAISVSGTTDDDRVFTIETRWPRFGLGADEVLTLTYRPVL